MSILETNKIDMVASRPDTATVKLVIADHLTWDDLDGHCQLIQEKINTYLAFVESGQLSRLEEPKLPGTPEVQIVLAVQYEPSAEAHDFLAQVRDFLAGVRIGFELRRQSALQ